MNLAAQETIFLIHHLEVSQREIAIEGEAQLATIARVMAHHIPLHIEKLKKLEAYERGDKTSRFARAQQIRLIGD